MALGPHLIDKLVALPPTRQVKRNPAGRVKMFEKNWEISCPVPVSPHATLVNNQKVNLSEN